MKEMRDRTYAVRVMSVLATAEDGSMGSMEVSERTGLSHARSLAALARLEAMGWATRTARPRVGRQPARVFYELTTSGLAHLDRERAWARALPMPTRWTWTRLAHKWRG